jgi:hypothetical protein
VIAAAIGDAYASEFAKACRVRSLFTTRYSFYARKITYFLDLSLIFRTAMDKRITQRDRVLKAATIEFEGGAFSCMVRNISDRGAALDVPSLAGIPHDFTLVLPVDGLRLFCRSVWRKERRIGVTFD